MGKATVIKIYHGCCMDGGKKSMKRCIVLSCCICFIAVMLTGCGIFNNIMESLSNDKTGDVPVASIEGAREYLKSVYDKDITDITLLQQVYREEYEQPIGIDGPTGLSKTIPAQIKTCYLAYSADDDLYFLIFHDTVRKYYGDTLAAEKKKIEEFAEIIRWAEEFFGEDFIKINVDWYQWGASPSYDVRELEPIYDSPDSDVREDYNRLIKDIEHPYNSEYLLIMENASLIHAEPYLNIHVNASLYRLDQKYEGLQDIYIDMLYVLIYATDGVYDRPYLNG